MRNNHPKNRLNYHSVPRYLMILFFKHKSSPLNQFYTARIGCAILNLKTEVMSSVQFFWLEIYIVGI